MPVREMTDVEQLILEDVFEKARREPKRNVPGRKPNPAKQRRERSRKRGEKGRK